jgi:inorganic pyrophosphatase
MHREQNAGSEWVLALMMPGRRIAMTDSGFWGKLDRLVATSSLVIDRPKGSPHPRYPSFRYPLDYGYLQGTCSPDGDGIDVWIGGRADISVTGIIATLDLDKRDAELKLLLGCTKEEAQMVLAIHNQGSQAGVLIERECAGEKDSP